jgi:hypothetical protein
VLHEAVRESLATFLAESALVGGQPRHVERDFVGYLECGVLARGFSRIRCRACGDELLLAFSCKGRGVCPSCNARRAHDTAAHLVDNVLPSVPYRQWTLSFPKRIRWHLARDSRLMSAIRDVFLRALFGFLRAQARELGFDGQAGAITFEQRFSSALALNPHLHVLVPEGLFAPPPLLLRQRYLPASATSQRRRGGGVASHHRHPHRAPAEEAWSPRRGRLPLERP